LPTFCFSLALGDETGLSGGLGGVRYEAGRAPRRCRPVRRTGTIVVFLAIALLGLVDADRRNYPIGGD
jgi:hypothetical protein